MAALIHLASCGLLLLTCLASLSLAIDPPAAFTRPHNLTDFLDQRSALLAGQQAADFQSDAPPLSARESLANDRLMAAKRSVIRDSLTRPSHFPPALHFFDVNVRLRATPLWRMLRRMPKAAILHAHDTGMVSIDWLIAATYRPLLWHCSDAEAHDIRAFRFARHPPQSVDLAGSCAWRRTADERQRIGAQRFDARIRGHLTLRTGRPYATNQDVWRQLELNFGLVGSLVTYEPVWREYYRAVLQEAQEDGVQYVEFRGLLPALYDLDGRVQANATHIVQQYVDVLQEFRRENPEFVGSRFIYAPHRDVSDERIAEYMRIVRELNERFPDFVVGFDLVGVEDGGRTLLSVAKWLLELPEAVRFVMHAGETNWHGCEVDENLYDALLLGTRRLGHGYALAKHPTLVQWMRERDVAVELNPVSNQVMMLVADLRNHPASAFFAQNVPLIVSSDDPTYWEATPLTDDFYEAFVGIASAHADLRTLKKLARNSIRYSSLRENEKLEAYAKWEAQWTVYIEAVIAGDF